MLIEYKNHKIFAFSDTHGLNHRLDIPKDVDILICAGDCLKEDNMVYVNNEFLKFLNWYSHQDAKLKIYVPGNHEVFFEMNPEKAMQMIPSSIILLEDCGIEYDGISFWGAACRPWMFKGTENKIPKDVDFLITHGAAEGHLDNKAGCQVLKKMIEESKPKHHIFGHIHEDGGKIETTETTTYYNVSMYNQLKYHYPSVEENNELGHWVVKGIEEDIVNSYNLDDNGYEEGKSLLSLRRKLINEMVLSHQEDYIDDIIAFNDSLMDSLREMYDRACHIYSDMTKHKDYGDDIKLEARLFFSKHYPERHPIQGGDRQDLWDALLDKDWNETYDCGITCLSLNNGTFGKPFESFIGMDILSNWNDGLNIEKTKDMKLSPQFNHLFKQTEFAITDFIYVRDFYSEINVNITKGIQNNE